MTLTTVGYGDVYPITVGGRVFTFFVLVVGLGIVTVPSGLVAASLSKAREIQSSPQAESASADREGDEQTSDGGDDAGRGG